MSKRSAASIGAASRRRICFVTGTRAEFGLMETTLAGLRDHPQVELQIIATGSHTQASRGRTVEEIRRGGWHVNGVVPWADDASPGAIAREMGRITARLADHFERLDPDIVLVVGDRVEAFAAASAAHVGGRVLAHVHGGDRAMGQVDDALRHAISKLSHLHLCATRQSGERLFAMGEDRRRIHVTGAPGIDHIRRSAASRAELSNLGLDYRRHSFLLFLHHPTDADARAESIRIRTIFRGIRQAWSGPILALLPNNDPGAEGIAEQLHIESAAGITELFTHMSRRAFLGLMRDCAALVGNSSSGIIEAGSFGTRVVDIGPRQAGRERGSHVVQAECSASAVAAALRTALRRPAVRRADNPYDRGGAAARIAKILSQVRIDAALRRKVIRY